MNAREQWLSEKLGKFGASDLHNLLKSGRKKDELFGQGAMTLIHEKIAEILTGKGKEEVTGIKATEWGEDLEYDAVEFYADQTGEEVTYHGSGSPKFYPYNAFSGASPDAMGTDFSLECKCPFVSSNHVGYLIAARDKETAQAWLKDAHFDYYVQCQFAMMSCKVQRSVFISYDPRMIQKENKLAIIRIEPDEVLQADIKHRLNEAGKIIRSALALLNPQPHVLLAHNEHGVTIIEAAN